MYRFRPVSGTFGEDFAVSFAVKIRPPQDKLFRQADILRPHPITTTQFPRFSVSRRLSLPKPGKSCNRRAMPLSRRSLSHVRYICRTKKPVPPSSTRQAKIRFSQLEVGQKHCHKCSAQMPGWRQQFPPPDLYWWAERPPGGWRVASDPAPGASKGVRRDEPANSTEPVSDE